MSRVIDKATGEAKELSQNLVGAALNSDAYEPHPDETYTMRDRSGNTLSVPGKGMAVARAGGAVFESVGEQGARIAADTKDEYYSSPSQTIKGGAEALLGGATFGGSTALARLSGGKEAAEHMRGRSEALGGLGTALEITGAIVPALATGGASTLAKGLSMTPAGLAARGGAAIAKTGSKSAVKRVAGMAAGGAAEGYAVGAGQALHEISMSDEDITAERLVGGMHSGGLSGAKFGAVAGAGAGALVEGLRKAGSAVKKVRDATQRASDDAVGSVEALAKMDRAGLKAEQAAAKVSAKEAQVARAVAETDELGKAKAAFADEVVDFHKSLKKDAPWEAVTSKAWKKPGAKGKAKSTLPREVSKLGKEAYQIDKGLDRITGNMKGFRGNPERGARGLLQRQEQVYQEMLDQGDTILGRIAQEGRQGGKRAQAFEKIEGLLEKNRAFQQRLDDIAATEVRIKEAARATPTSPYLEAVEESLETVGERSRPGLAQNVVQTGVFSGATAALYPVIGIAAPVVGKAAADVATGVLFKGLRKSAAGAAVRTEAAVQKLLGIAEAGAKAAPIPTAKLLADVSYGAGKKAAAPKATAGHVSSYQEREKELREQTGPGPEGKPVMSAQAREGVAERLAGVRAVDPLLADQMESAHARKIEFLADKLPKRPDYLASEIGPSRWRPSKYEIAQFARYAAAVENPVGVIERAGTHVALPEEAEALEAVYPEMYADLQERIVMSLPSVKKRLSYKQRLSLSVLTGQPLDPAMRPEMVRLLQDSFAAEPGTEGGTMAPRAQPQFGSLSKSLESPTPAQERAG